MSMMTETTPGAAIPAPPKGNSDRPPPSFTTMSPARTGHATAATVPMAIRTLAQSINKLTFGEHEYLCRELLADSEAFGHSVPEVCALVHRVAQRLGDAMAL